MTSPADFIRDNLAIELNVVDEAYKCEAKKLLFLGSSCIYSKFAPQPIKEDYLLTGKLEPTNEAYAIAKIAGAKLCEAYNEQYETDFVSVMPTNLYGPNDNFDIETSHVLPALIRRFHEAKDRNEPQVIVWGTGKPRREFMYVDDFADACIHIMNTYSGNELINIGVGKDISIGELAELIRDVVGYQGNIIYDTTKPDGTPRKLLDVSKLEALGWQPKFTLLRDGIEKLCNWWLKDQTKRHASFSR